MPFLDNLLTLKANIVPQRFMDYDFYVVPHGREPTFERLRTLLSPGERRDKQLMMRLLGVRPAGLEVYFSEAGLPLILPTPDEKGFPSSLRTVELKPSADMEAILYDYIEHWKKRGDPAVLNDLFQFGSLPSRQSPYDLGYHLRFVPSAHTLQQIQVGGDVVYRSRLEKVEYSGDHNLYLTYHVTHEVNLLREVLSCTIRYWLHDSLNHVTPENEDKRPLHAEFAVRRQGRSNNLLFSGHAGTIDLRNRRAYTRMMQFNHAGHLVDPSTGRLIQDPKEKRPSQCDFNATLRQLVDIVTGWEGWHLPALAKLSYVKLK